MQLRLDSLTYGNDAIGRTPEGKAVFTSGGVPGDTVEVEFTDEKKRFAHARITKILEPSPHRVTSPCQWQGICGGCPWGMVDYNFQLTAKRQNVVDQLVRIAKFSPDMAESIVKPTIPSDKKYGYRNKIELNVELINNQLTLGYHAAESQDLIAVQKCPLAAGKAKDLPRAVQGALRYLAGKGETLGIERVSIRNSVRTNDLEIALWTGPSSFPRHKAVQLLVDASNPTSIVRVILKSNPKKRAVSKIETLHNTGFWSERLKNHVYQVSAPSFFQVNTSQAEVLIRLVLNELEQSHSILDLYSGVGTFTLPLSSLGKQVVSVESYGPAVRNQRENLEAYGYEATVIGGDVTRELKDILNGIDALIVDPPRAGLTKSAIQTISSSTSVKKIVYVSCDPATLARDLAVFKAQGWQPQTIQPVDLFPQTYHVECVTSLIRE